jgi:GTP cyclohydrolase II
LAPAETASVAAVLLTLPDDANAQIIIELADATVVRTVDAYKQLGSETGERVYQPIAEILRQLGFEQIGLLQFYQSKFKDRQVPHTDTMPSTG